MEAETFLGGKVTLHCGDCIEVLRKYPDNHFDSLVSDPPYGLEFMGKEWDGADGFRRSLNKADAERVSVMGRMSRKAPEYKAGHLFQEWCEAWAREALRVLKPGGFIVCFGGTRTFHRLVSAIEDAGFEVRDMIAWLYGSGFPKNLNVSKAIDKIDVIGPMRERALKFTAWMRSTGITAKQINDCTGTCMASHYLTDKEQPAVAVRDLFEKMRPYFGCDVPADIEDLVDSRTVESENLKRREVVAVGHSSKSHIAAVREESGDYLTTVAATEAAKEWEGWGTALKPAIEPICLARKPLEADTVAGNVLLHGTGGINVNGCRVGSELMVNPHGTPGANVQRLHGGDGRDADNAKAYAERNKNPSNEAIGRWPANVVHDGSYDVKILFPDVHGAGAACGDKFQRVENVTCYGKANIGVPTGRRFGDDGSAARFFYEVKPDLDPICLARKPLSEGTVAENVLKHGTGAVNVDGCRVAGEDAESGRSRHGGGGGWEGSRFKDAQTVMPEGRWPANVVHDGSQEVMGGFPETKSGVLATHHSRGTKTESVYGKFKHNEQSQDFGGDEGSAGRFFYQVKPDVDPICLARKPLSEDTVAENILKHGTGGLNVDGCRVESSEADQEYISSRIGGFNNTKSIGGKGSGILGGGKVIDRTTFDPSKGRWPANVLHDGSQEVVETFPETAPGSAAVRNNGAFKSVAKGVETAHLTGGHGDEGGSAARYFYAVKPDLDPICLARKPLAKGTVAENVVKHGTGGLNIDGCRVEGKLWPGHETTGFGSDKFFSEGERSKYHAEPHAGGRWPANVVTDGSQEVVGAFPETKSGELGPQHKHGRSSIGSQHEGWDRPSHRNYKVQKEYGGDSGSAARFFYTAKAGNDDRLGSSHPTIKPIDLMQWLVRLVTPPGGLVLEPFAGSGTTGEAAFREGMRAVLIELDPVSCDDIRRRMALVMAGPRARKAATVKAKIKSGRIKTDDGPLFTMTEKIASEV